MFSGNTDSETVVYNKLPSSIKTRFIRLLPTQWRNQISMRIEVYGCPGNKLIMIEKIGLFYNRVDTFFLHEHSPLGNNLYLFSLCQALGQCRQAKERASSEIATEWWREERRGNSPQASLQISRSVHYPLTSWKIVSRVKGPIIICRLGRGGRGCGGFYGRSLDF